MGRFRVFRVLVSCWLPLIVSTLCWAQPAAPAPPSISGSAGATPMPHSAESLYMQLRGVGLDPSRVFRVRGASIDREALHITLDDGTIGFTEDIAGRVTGAFFEGDGEALLIPPNQTERASMSLFTGAAILEEKFVTAYFRFNDHTFEELRPFLRSTDNAHEFVSQWTETAHNLAEGDALRLLLTFSRFLPSTAPASASENATGSDRFLHARVQGRKLGIFDLTFDSNGWEEISAGQLRSTEGATFYDLWTSFSLNHAKSNRRESSTVSDAGKTDTINIVSYKIRAEVHPPTNLDADATVQLEVRQGGQRAAVFELSRFLKIKQIEADGRPVEFIHNQAVEGTQLARRGNDLLAIVFPQPLQTGQKIELHFVYGGEVLSEAGGGLLYVGARGTWYPNRGLAMSTFDLEFHYPAGWSLIATGKMSDIIAAPPSPPGAGTAGTPGMQVSHWISERPIPVAGFNLGKYSRAVAHAGDVTVETFATTGVERNFPKMPAQAIAPPSLPSRRQLPSVPLFIEQLPPSPARNAQLVADASARAITFYAQRYGPFPYGSLALAQMPGNLSQGWPGLIFLSSLSFLTPQEKSELHANPVENILSSQVVAHETAHQWWGDLLTWSGYRDQWTMEALANYSSLMLLESENPAQFRAVMDNYRENLFQENKEKLPLMMAGPVTFGLRLSNSHFPNGYDAISYGRGTWLFHMLRHMMRDSQMPGERSSGTNGDEPFTRALHTLRDRYQGKSVSTAEILQVFEEYLPPSLCYEGRKSLDWFYQGWIEGTDIPRFDLQGVKFADKHGATVVTGTVLQKSASNDLVTSIPVYAAVIGKLVLLGRVFVDGPESTFRLNAPSGTRKIVLDPNQTLLSRNR